jgi:hypothetical protein
MTRNPYGQPLEGDPGDEAYDTVPMHCGRGMLAVKNSFGNHLPNNAPIWWCVECHYRLPRTES